MWLPQRTFYSTLAKLASRSRFRYMKKKQYQQTEQQKLQRMLKWFEGRLPEHEIGKWFFEIEPRRIPVMDETEVLRMSSNSYGLLVGYGSCIRCGLQFNLARWGNYSVHSPAEQEGLKEESPTLITEAIVLKAQQSIQQEAERSGKCWGEIPKIDEESGFFVESHSTLDRNIES